MRNALVLTNSSSTKRENMTNTVVMDTNPSITTCLSRTKQRLIPVGRKSLLTSMCAISTLLILISIFYWYPGDLSAFYTTSSNQEDFKWLSPTDLDQCAGNVTLSTTNFILNLTIPDWMELLSGYIQLQQHKSGWTIFRLPNNQYYLDNQTIIKSNKTKNDSKIAEFGQPLLLARVNLSLALWNPILCDPRVSTAIIIPYRNREEHLRALLHTLPAFLIHQNIRFTIFVIEQKSDTRFNRALLFNVGFIESKRIGTFDCYIFHDVDLLPADLRVPYSCGSQPVHLAASMDKFGYRLPYTGFVGGVLALSRKQFIALGGFSNYYFGWGGEDDDMFHRIKKHNFSVFRPKMTRYRMIRHGKDKLNEKNNVNLQLLTLAQKKTTDSDGYLHADYQVLSAGPRYNGLVYWIEIDVHESKLTAQRDALLKGK